MQKKIISVIIAVALILLTCCSCGKASSVSVVTPINEDPTCLDPQIAVTDSAKLIINNCWEGLVRLNKDGKIIPGVAQTWDISDDGLTYTFHLGKKSSWQILKSHEELFADKYDAFSKATEYVTAEDFEFALQRATMKSTDAPDADTLFVIKNAQKVYSGKSSASSLGVKATDSSTLVITLERSSDDFLRILTTSICMPCNKTFFYQTRAKYGLDLKYTLCNGPFYVSKWTKDNSVNIRKNENYLCNKVTPETIYFSINTDEQSIVSRLKKESYNVAKLSSVQYDLLKNNKNITFSVTSNLTWGFLFNCSDETLGNKEIRLALMYATNLQKMEKPDSVSGIATGIVPDSCRFGETNYRSRAGKLSAPQYNKKQAVSMWKKGLEEINADAVKIKIYCNKNFEATLRELIQNWQQIFGISITVSVESIEEKDLQDKISDDDFQVIMTSLTASDSNPVKFLNQFKSNNDLNISNYKSSEYDSLIDSALTQLSGTDIIKGYKKAEQYLIDKAVFFPFFKGKSYVAQTKGYEATYQAPSSEYITFISSGSKS